VIPSTIADPLVQMFKVVRRWKSAGLISQEGYAQFLELWTELHLNLIETAAKSVAASDPSGVCSMCKDGDHGKCEMLVSRGSATYCQCPTCKQRI
jgi:hypothetical protein